jgi:hypothetical protein
MRHDAEDIAVQSAPAICIALSKLKEVDGPLKLVLSRIRINSGVLVIYLDESAGTNHRVQCEVIHPNESVEIFPKGEILNERDGDFAPSLHHAREEVRFLDPRSRIEPRWKTQTAFRVIDLGWNEMSLGQFDGEASCADLIQIDSKEQKEVYEINPIESAECKQLVDTWNPGGVLYLDQRAVRDAISFVSLRARD